MSPFSFKSLALILCLPFICLPVKAKQGGEGSGGGGDVILCHTGPYKGVYLADTFEVFGVMKTPIPQVSKSFFESFFISLLEQRNPHLRNLVAPTLNSLKFKAVSQLEEFDDDFINSLPTGCSKKQLAIQDLSDGTIRYNEYLWQRLSVLEQVLFRNHEAIIHIRNRPGNTTEIRESIQKSYEYIVSPYQLPFLISKYFDPLRSWIPAGVLFHMTQAYGNGGSVYINEKKECLIIFEPINQFANVYYNHSLVSTELRQKIGIQGFRIYENQKNKSVLRIYISNSNDSASAYQFLYFGDGRLKSRIDMCGDAAATTSP